MRTLYLIAVAIIVLIVTNCTSKNKFDIFGKSYNKTRNEYGSPIIHDYMIEIRLPFDSIMSFETPIEIQNTIKKGYHAGKTFYIYKDSILQEDDIFRKRISDSTFAFIGILTYGNRQTHSYSSIYYDTTCAKDIGLKDFGKSCTCSFPKNELNKISITKADSILEAWGTSRIK